MNRGDLSNEQRDRLHPTLPPQKPVTGRPAHDYRTLKPFRRLATRYEKLAVN
jgi:hypothetical protein